MAHSVTVLIVARHSNTVRDFIDFDARINEYQTLVVIC